MYKSTLMDELTKQLSAAKIQKIQDGFDAYSKAERQGDQSEINEAIAVLSQMSDIEAFTEFFSQGKSAEKLGAMSEMKGFATDEVFMDQLNALQSDAKSDDGWKEMLKEEGFIMVTKDLRPDLTMMRAIVNIDLPVKEADLMMTHIGSERTEWDENCKKCEVVKELGPGDQVCNWELKLNRVLKTVFKVPDKMCMRFMKRQDWPEKGSVGYAIMPYDLEKGVTLEELGPMKIKVGVIKPDPADPNKSILESLESANLKYVPTFVLKGMLKKMGKKKLQELVTTYKKSSFYKANQ